MKNCERAEKADSPESSVQCSQGLKRADTLSSFICGRDIGTRKIPIYGNEEYHFQIFSVVMSDIDLHRFFIFRINSTGKFRYMKDYTEKN